MTNPFNRSLDWAFRGKYVHVVAASGATYRGWVDRIHHNQGSIVLHDATPVEDGREQASVGSVFLRLVEEMYVIKPKQAIEYLPVDSLTPSPYLDHDFEVSDRVMRAAYRNQFTGSFPVVRTTGEIINGHKRIEACKRAGLRRHACEVVQVTDEEAEALVRLAHRGAHDDEADAEDADETDAEDADETDAGDGGDDEADEAVDRPDGYALTE